MRTHDFLEKGHRKHKNQSEMKNTIYEMKNTLDSKLDKVED